MSVALPAACSAAGLFSQANTEDCSFGASLDENTLQALKCPPRGQHNTCSAQHQDRSLLHRASSPNLRLNTLQVTVPVCENVHRTHLTLGPRPKRYPQQALLSCSACNSRCPYTASCIVCSGCRSHTTHCTHTHTHASVAPRCRVCPATSRGPTLHTPGHAVHLQRMLYPCPACRPLPCPKAVAVRICQHQALQQLDRPAGIAAVAALCCQPQPQLDLCQAGLGHAGCDGVIQRHSLLQDRHQHVTARQADIVSLRLRERLVASQYDMDMIHVVY